ncbi:hypothetical protein [Neglectibacter timonensis]|uniref:Uncharacterized protein n=1 Tax=Neglectibacter timonensis TaxID=1776382 RepID=A0ABT1RZ51_9FIRM|nr:hypothetical protein [Neglectibacter timonensis]MCQ4839963.1 hypothetical protein [Neglectibacter timonensis]MCQ4843728.1 hypothetical protein [Neglectibacter timonensis]
MKGTIPHGVQPLLPTKRLALVFGNLQDSLPFSAKSAQRSACQGGKHGKYF